VRGVEKSKALDYRLAPETKLPDIISDIETAFTWLGGEGAKRFHLDPDRMIVYGGSAGGYLTLVTGYRVKPKPKALVALIWLWRTECGLVREAESLSTLQH